MIRYFKSCASYLNVIVLSWQTQEPLDNVERFAKGYEDYLQCPLQVSVESNDCYCTSILYGCKRYLCTRIERVL